MPKTCLMGGAAKSAPDLPTVRVSAAMLRAASSLVVDAPGSPDLEDWHRARTALLEAIPAVAASDRRVNVRALAYALATFGAALGDDSNHDNHEDRARGERAHAHALAALDLAAKLLRLCVRAG